MSDNTYPEPAADPSSPYGPTTAVADARVAAPITASPLRRNPIGVAALVAAGLLIVAQAIFQVLAVSAVKSGDYESMQFVLRLVQPLGLGILGVATAVLGTIAVLLPGRARLAGGVGLGVGIYSLASMIISFVVNLGYSLF